MNLSVTSVLDLCGVLLVIAAVAVFIGQWSTAGALAASGVGLLAASWLIDRSAAQRRRAAGGQG